MDWLKNIPDFTVRITVEACDYSLLVQHVYLSNQIEKFKISGMKGSFILLRSDRPFLRFSNSKKQIHWSLLEGKVRNEKSFTELIQKIEAHIKNMESPYDPDWQAARKRY